MQSRRASWVVVGIVALAPVIAFERGARACEPIAGEPESCPLYFLQFLPFAGTIPSNAPAVITWDGYAEGHEAAVRILREQQVCDDVPLEPMGHFDSNSLQARVYGFRGPLAEGADYRFELEDKSSCNPVSSSFHVGKAAPLPTNLGTLREARIFTAPALWNGTDSSCGVTLQSAVSEVEIDFAPEASPWRNLFVYDTFVDDMRYSESHSQGNVGRGKDEILAACEPIDPHPSPGSEKQFPTGQHSVKMRARLPGTDIALETEPITVDLRCDQPADRRGSREKTFTRALPLCPAAACSVQAGVRGDSGRSANGWWAAAVAAIVTAMAARRRGAHRERLSVDPKRGPGFRIAR